MRALYHGCFFDDDLDVGRHGPVGQQHMNIAHRQQGRTRRALARTLIAHKRDMFIVLNGC